MDPNGQAYAHLLRDGMCTNCTLLSAEIKLADADGRILSAAHGVYIHHILSVDISKPWSMPVSPCEVEDNNMAAPMNLPGAPIFGSGDDSKDTAIYYTSLDGTYNSGYHIRDKYTVLAQSDLVNYNHETREVYISLDFEYVDGIVGMYPNTNRMF